MVKRQRLNSCMHCLLSWSTDVEVIVKRQRFSRCVHCLLSGSTGVGCELYTDDNCDSSPCLNGATRSIGSSGRVCSCAPGTPGCLSLFVSTMMMKLPAGIHAVWPKCDFLLVIIWSLIVLRAWQLAKCVWGFLYRGLQTVVPLLSRVWLSFLKRPVSSLQNSSASIGPQA